MPIFILSSCKKDDVIIGPAPNQTEIIAKRLQNLIDENGITMVSVYVFNAQDNSWNNVVGTSDFQVEDPYIRVEKTYYDLSKLVKFNVQSVLALYFKY